MCFPSGSVVKNTPAMQGRGFNPWIRKTPWEGNGNLLQYSGLGNPMDRLHPMGAQSVGHDLVTEQQPTLQTTYYLLLRLHQQSQVASNSTLDLLWSSSFRETRVIILTRNSHHPPKVNLSGNCVSPCRGAETWMASVSLALMLSHSAVAKSLWPSELQPSRLPVHGISQQEYWSGVPLSPLGDLPNPGMAPTSASPALQVDFLPLSHQGSPAHISAMPNWLDVLVGSIIFLY